MIDADQLASALELSLSAEQPDFRTRLLIRDAAGALKHFWGEQRFTSWRNGLASKDRLCTILREPFDSAGFPSLQSRLMNATRPETVLEFLRELSTHARQQERLIIGGSTALILNQRLNRHTDDIDLVDELPAQLRTEHEFLNGLIIRYGLRLAHFQSHYLPSGWQTRLKSLGKFGQLEVHLVDEYDIAVGKLFSARDKDRDDLRALSKQLDKAHLTERLRSAAQSFLTDEALRANAAKNWYIVYGDQLPA
jgi:hypothetical protein